MTQSEAILEYIDGTLDHDAEQALFDSMARHPELRSTLRQFISIGSAVHADREAYAPPAHVEQALLAGLGLVPSSTGAVAASSATGSLLGWFGGKIGGMTLSFLAGVLLAGSLVYWMTRDGGSLPPDRRVATATATPPAGGNAPSAEGASREIATSPGAAPAPTRDAAATAPLPPRGGTIASRESAASSASGIVDARASSALVRDRSGSDGGSRTTRRGSRVDGIATSDGAHNISSTDRSGSDVSRPADGGVLPTRPDGSGAASSSRPVPSIEAARLRTASPALPPVDGSGAPPAPRSMSPSQSSPIAPAEAIIARQAFAELRGKAGASLNPTNARNGGSPAAFMNNLAVGAYMMMGRSFAVGIEGGSEAYDQVLSFDSGDTDKVEQRPTYVWGGVAGRYYLGTIPGIELQPFMQGTLGFTSAGPLGRIRLGAGYDLGTAALNIGVEASTLVYSFNGRPLMSGRVGATVGAEVRLW